MAGAEPLALPHDLVFVDLETTGGNAAHHRITEVGIVRMTDGVVIEEWSSLVNPGCRIPSFIEAFTGITTEMVEDAPRFADISSLVLDKLGVTPPGASVAPIFVAHNARFDYSFLRTEFRRLDVRFSARVLCTAKLSRRLYPEFPRHNLDAIMERHRLRCTARHRALGDARVLGDFWSQLRTEVPAERLAGAAGAVLGAHRLPDYLPAGLADELPDGPGVYRFFDADGAVLHIGRSHSLRTAVLGHFAGEDSAAAKEPKLRLVRNIDWQETAGDLGAQLQQIEWRRVKRKDDGFTLKPLPDGHGVRLTPISEIDPGDLPGCFGVFHAAKDGRKALLDIARAHSLCPKIMGLEESSGSCLGYQIGRCKGACVGREPLMLHNVRLQMALSTLKLKSWPFPGRVALQEGGSDYHVLDHWVYLGTARSEEQLADLRDTVAPGRFDVDVYRILMRHLAKNPGVRWHDLR